MKRKYETPEDGRRRGYTSFGVEHAKDSKKADLKEFFHVGRELPSSDPFGGRLPKNLWPAEVQEVEAASKALYAALDRVAFDILEAFSVYLDQPRPSSPRWPTRATPSSGSSITPSATDSTSPA